MYPGYPWGFWSMVLGADGADGPAEMVAPLKAVDPPGVGAPAPRAGGSAAAAPSWGPGACDRSLLEDKGSVWGRGR